MNKRYLDLRPSPYRFTSHSLVLEILTRKHTLLGQSDPEFAPQRSNEISGLRAATGDEHGLDLVHLLVPRGVAAHLGDLAESREDNLDGQLGRLELHPLGHARRLGDQAQIAC